VLKMLLEVVKRRDKCKHHSRANKRLVSELNYHFSSTRPIISLRKEQGANVDRLNHAASCEM
jgi:hypothetical protein